MYGYACEGIIEIYQNQWHELVHSFNAYSLSHEHSLIPKMSSSEVNVKNHEQIFGQISFLKEYK